MVAPRSIDVIVVVSDQSLQVGKKEKQQTTFLRSPGHGDHSPGITSYRRPVGRCRRFYPPLNVVRIPENGHTLVSCNN